MTAGQNARKNPAVPRGASWQSSANATRALSSGAMVGPGTREATYQDIIDLPVGVVGQIVFGVLHSFSTNPSCI